MRATVIHSIEDLDQYREDWDRLRQACRASIFSSFDLIRLWLDSYRSVFIPQMILVEDKGRLAGAAPFCMSKYGSGGLRVRNLTMVGNGKDIVGYSLAAILAREDVKEVVRTMARSLDGIRWNLMQLSDIDPLPGSLRFLESIERDFGSRPSQDMANLLYEFPPEGDIASRFGARTRTSLRSARRSLEKEGRLHFRTVRTVEEAEAAMHLYTEMHIARWAKKGGSIYRDARNARMLVDLGKLVTEARTGAIYELLLDGEVAAQLMAFFDGETVRAYRVGMDDRFSHHSPGKLAVMLCMEAQRDRGYKRMDMLHGNEPYKRGIMTHERSLRAIQVQRGSLGAMSKVRSFPPIRRLDERLGVGERMLKRINRG